MEISSNLKLCLLLVSSAIRRCWMSQRLCRLSVAVHLSSSTSSRQLSRVSISDTGIGSSVDDFKILKCTQIFAAENYSDGVLSIATTSISDNEIQNYQIYIKEGVSPRRVNVLPSQPKNGARFSGTEVSFSTVQDISGLLPEILCFLKKMLILGIPIQKDSIDLMVQHYIGPMFENPVVTNGCNLSPDASTIERLKSGFQDYILKHGNKSDTKCMSCFPDHCKDILKVGTGMVYCKEGERDAGLLVETVVIISDSPDPSSPCFREFGTDTEVVLFNDFSPSLLTQTTLAVLTKMDWKSYGLILGNVLDLDGHALLEWENLPPSVHIDIALHCYQSSYPSVTMMLPATKTTQFVQRKRIKTALRQALEDIKERHAGMLLSANALKVYSHAPDLAKTIAGLILSSDYSDFQGECVKLLGLRTQDQTIEKESIETCLNEKIMKAISLNDKRSCTGRQPAPLLFEDDAEDLLKSDNFQVEEFD